MVVSLRFLALLFIGWAFIRLIRFGFALFLKKIAKKAKESSGVSDMVKDPNCGTYVSVEHAVTGVDKSIYFCSQKCRDEYMEKK